MFSFAKQIDMSELRRRLFGEDRLPLNPETLDYPATPIKNKIGEVFLTVDVRVVPVVPVVGRKRMKQRLEIRCSCCGGWFAAAKYSQHQPSCERDHVEPVEGGVYRVAFQMNGPRTPIRRIVGRLVEYSAEFDSMTFQTHKREKYTIHRSSIVECRDAANG